MKKYLENKYESFYVAKYYQKTSHIELNDDDFGDFLENNREKIIKDIKIVVNKEFVVESSKIRLSVASNYFKYLLSGRFSEANEVEISLPSGNIVLFEILLNYLLLDHLIVPYGMSYQSWI